MMRWNVQFLYPTGSPFFLQCDHARIMLRPGSGAEHAAGLGPYWGPGCLQVLRFGG